MAGDWQEIMFGRPQAVAEHPVNGDAMVIPINSTIHNSSYVNAAIAQETAALAAMGAKSGRNHQLNRAAFNLRRFIDNGSVDEQTIFDALMGAAAACGVLAEDGQSQCESSIRSGFRGSQTKVGARPSPAPRVGYDTATVIEPPAAVAVEALTLEAIEEDFWTARDGLALIYRAALSRMASPWAVLACCAARVLCLVPPAVTLPPIIGGAGSLNWFAAIAAKSGGGKGAAMTVADELVGDPVTVHGIGSGEGMVETYRRNGEPEDAVISVLFSVDEIDTLGAMRGRSGQTTMTILRQGFSGERLGFSYRGRQGDNVAAHTYRMTLVAAVQPGRAGVLFDDAAGGTPQRFMWFPGRDKRITADPPPWPYRELDTAPLRDIAGALGDIKIPGIVIDTVRSARAASMSGDDNALDGHSLFCREKFAFFLAFIDGRMYITEEDWRLSGIAATVSDWCRDRVQQSWLDEQHQQSRERGALRAVENDERGIVEQLTLNRHLARIVVWIAKTLTTHGPLTAGELNRRAPSRDRTRLMQAVAGASEQGLIKLTDDGKWALT